MFKVLLLIISVTGQPISIVEGPSAQKYDTMEACTQAAPDEISKAIDFIKEKGVADKIAIGMAMCWNDTRTEHSDPIMPQKTKMETPAKSGQDDI